MSMLVPIVLVVVTNYMQTNYGDVAKFIVVPTFVCHFFASSIFGTCSSALFTHNENNTHIMRIIIIISLKHC